MASSNETVSMALFCDFENVALGVRDAKYDKFDIKLVLERLLLKGSIVVKKAYCDWDRYKSFKGAMHEANFELIEIPHVRQSGKNSADIRLVVDALDLCYTKSHVNTFVIISGDSDFSPLVSKLRENAKQVIGVGVQQSTSDLLIANCDEFFFYDDLVRESQRAVAKRESSRPQQSAQQSARRAPEEEKTQSKEALEKRRTKAVEIAVQTFDALASERGDSGKIWASVLKNAIKRRKPDFNETYYGFRAFGNLLEEAQARGLLEFGRDEKSGAYVYRSTAVSVSAETVSESGEAVESAEQPYEAQAADSVAGAERGGKHESRRRGRENRKAGRDKQKAAREEQRPAESYERAAAYEEDQQAPSESPDVIWPDEASERVEVLSVNKPFVEQSELALSGAEAPKPEAKPKPEAEAETGANRGETPSNGPHTAENDSLPKRSKQRSARKTPARKVKKEAQRTAGELPEIAAPTEESPPVEAASVAAPPAKKAARKTTARSRRPKKATAESDPE